MLLRQVVAQTLWISVRVCLPRISVQPFVHAWLAKKEYPSVGILIRKEFKCLLVSPLLMKGFVVYLLNFLNKWVLGWTSLLEGLTEQYIIHPQSSYSLQVYHCMLQERSYSNHLWGSQRVDIGKIRFREKEKRQKQTKKPSHFHNIVCQQEHSKITGTCLPSRSL